MKIHYRGPFGQHTGYAAAGHDTLLALHRAGHELDIEPLFDWSHVDKRYAELVPCVERCEAPDWADVMLCHSPPFGCPRLIDGDLKPPPKVHRVAMTTWETSKLPGDIGADLSEHFDCVMVPCQQNQAALVAGGTNVRKPVYVLPHCFDPTWWRAKQTPNEGPYTFLYVGAWNYRKNPRGVVVSYLSEFDKDDDVMLVLKVGGASNIREEIESIKRSLNLSEYPPIELVTGTVDDATVRGLHIASDCFVSTHRGEGWGLGIFESALVGNPFIATGFGGPCDFAELGTDYLVPYNKTPAMVPEEIVPTAVAGVSMVRRVDPTTGISGKQWWAEPCLDACMKQMRAKYSLGQQVRENRHELESAYAYGEVADRFEVLLA